MSAIVICETRSANHAMRKRYGTAIEWFLDSAEWLTALPGRDPRYVTLYATGEGDADRPTSSSSTRPRLTLAWMNWRSCVPRCSARPWSASRTQHEPRRTNAMTADTKKPARFARVVSRLACGTLLVVLEDRRPRSSKLTHYYLERMEADYGRAFRFRKFGTEGGEVYEVNIGGDGEPSSCECMGHLAHGHKTVCRHVAAARALLAAGKLA